MPALQTAKLDWQGDVPRAINFDDIYYSTNDGLAESRHVFCRAMGDAATWWQKPSIRIAETGFGTGLNFLASWQKWHKLATKDARLHYISAEGFPLTKLDLIKALARWPELSIYTQALIAAYPVLHPGFHRLYFEDGRVSLSLLIGDATQMFTQLDIPVDAWFLDGFSPAKNPSMWHDGLFQQLTRLSRKGTKLATFTAASEIRRRLQTAGFKIEKSQGFGAKRECLRGLFEGCQTSASLPWFAPPPPIKKGASIAIIGAGIAGISCYQALLRAGYEPILFERHQDVAAGGSGNPVVLIQPRLTVADGLDGQFNATAYLNCVRHYDDLEKTLKTSLWYGERGGVQLARNKLEEARYQQLVEETRLPKDEMIYLEANKLSELAGINIQKPGLYFPSAGSLQPKKILSKLSKNMNITFNSDIANLVYQKRGWQLIDSTGKIIASANAVILANAHEAIKLADIRDLALTAKGGQISFLPATKESLSQKCGLSFGNYITPAFTSDTGQQYHVAGASYHALDGGNKFSTQKIMFADHQKNLDGLSKISNAYGQAKISDPTFGRAAVRATTIDHLPVVGPLHLGDECDQNYHDLRHGKPARNYPAASYQKDIYCITGLGSRGFQTAPLLANALADMISGNPNALEKQFLNAIHPIRFQIRKLKRKRGH